MPDIDKLLQQAPYWLGLPVLISILGFTPDNILNQPTLLMLYLVAVLICSLRSDLQSVIACALLSFILFNFFHTEPQYSLVISNTPEIITALVFVIFAILVGTLSHQSRKQLQLQHQRSRFLQAQVKLGEQLQHITNEEEVLPLMDPFIKETFNGHVQFRLLPPHAGDNPNDSWYLTWQADANNKPLGDQKTMLFSLREQVQATLERLAVNRELQIAIRKSDEERLRNALLSSVSHDLKTPLVTMMGAATTLRDLDKDLSPGDRNELLDSIISETGRLEGYIQNLLDMTRLGHGKLSLSREWISLNEIYHVVSKRISRQWPHATLKFDSSSSDLALNIHAALIEQALFNALDNAVKAQGGKGEVLVSFDCKKNKVEIRICDHGPGLPESQWEAVFDQFYTFNKGDCYEKGTGLGLSICRSIFRIHGGDAVIIKPLSGYSLCLLLTLPLDTAARVSEAAS